MARHIAELRVVGTNQGGEYVNVLHFANDQTFVDNSMIVGALIQLATAMIQCWTVHMLPILHPSFVLHRVTAKLITGDNHDEVEVTDGAGPGQASSVDALPAFVAVQVTKRTGGGGRRGRGFMYLPSPTENRASLSSLDTDGMTANQAFINCVLGKFVGAGKTTDWEIGVYSRANDAGIGGTPDNSFRGCTQLLLNPVLAKIGRRKVGIGS